MPHNKSRRKTTGGKRKGRRKRRKHELRRESINCKLTEDSEKRKKIDVRGINEKVRARGANKVNVTNKETGETKQEEIDDVLENPANPHLVRRNALTKGTIVKIGDKKAVITSRPGQSGQINAVEIS